MDWNLCSSPVQTDRIEVMDNSNVTLSTVQEYDEQQNSDYRNITSHTTRSTDL